MGNLIFNSILIVLGLIGLFRGFKLFKIYLALSTFVLGFFFAYNILQGQDQTLQLGGSLVIGVLLGLTSYAIYKLGMFLIFMSLSAELVRSGITYFAWDLGVYYNWAILATSVIIGATMLVLGIEKIVLILATSLGGAAYIVLGAAAAMKESFPVGSYNVFVDLTALLGTDQNFLIVYIILVIIGVIFQVKTVK
jgi:hypothetical protein